MSNRMSSSAPKHAPGAPRMPFALLILGLIGGSLCLLLALNTASAANEVRRHDLAVTDASVADSLVQLDNDVNSSAAPQNLAAAAAALGMVPANNPAFLVIGADGKVRLMGSPGAATAPAVRVAPTKPSPSSTPSSSASAAGKASGSPSSSATTTGTAKSGTASSSAHTTPTSSNTPTPSPTPTPNTTLPGGPR